MREQADRHLVSATRARRPGTSGRRCKPALTGSPAPPAVSSETVYLRAVFKGDSAYAGSRSNLLTVTPHLGTTLTLTPSTATPQSGQSYTLSGSLSDSKGIALANKPIDIWYRHVGETTGHLWKTIQTGADGKYSTTRRPRQDSLPTGGVQGRQRVCGFEQRPRDGDVRGRCQRVSRSPQAPRPPSQASPTPSPAPSATAPGIALANKPIDIWYRHAGETTGHLWKTIQTGADGKYSTTAVPAKTVYLRAVFKGDSAFAGSSSDLVTISVH